MALDVLAERAHGRRLGFARDRHAEVQPLAYATGARGLERITDAVLRRPERDGLLPVHNAALTAATCFWACVQ